MPHSAVLLHKLAASFALSPEEQSAILALPFQHRSFSARNDVVRERDRLSQCCLLISGIACRYAVTADGRRQIFSFHLAGDIPDLHSLHLDAMDHSFAAVTPITVGFIPHSVLRDFMRIYPRISDLFWRDTLIEASIFRAWMTGLGVRSALARLAHFFCEIVTRLKSVALIGDHQQTIPFPIPQTLLAEALGLSNVHVNRTLNLMRTTGLLCMERGKLAIKDWDRLREAGDFDPAYLHLRPPPTAGKAASGTTVH